MWSKEETEFLKKNYATMRSIEICKTLNRGNLSIYKKAFELGLKKQYAKHNQCKEKVHKQNKLRLNDEEKIVAIKFFMILAKARLHIEETGEKANIKLPNLREAFGRFEFYEM